MSSLIQAIQTEDTHTLNGAITHSTTSKAILDLFFQISAMRNSDEQAVISLFAPAFVEHPLDAMKILFYARDIRGGQGERKTFRTLIRYLSQVHPEVMEKNLHLIPIFGRYDDLFEFVDTKLENAAFAILSDALKKNDGLCAKWCPRSKSAKHKIAEKFRAYLGLSPRQYRKMLSAGTKVVEQDMCANKWDDITYSHVPSLAMRNYRNAFEKHSPDRWKGYLTSVEKGEAKVNAGALYPHDVVRPILAKSKSGYAQRDNPFEIYSSSLTTDEARLLEQQWRAIPNYMEHNRERILPVIDTSGSMYSGQTINPIDVSIALGLYIAEKNVGVFQDSFITFSESPKLQKVSGGDLVSKVTRLQNTEWGQSTNIKAVFELILGKSREHQLSPNDLPSMILILSDMEFDYCGGNKTNFQAIKDEYQKYDYPMPKLVFWNLNALSGNFPVKFDQENVALVSGFSPSILKQLLSNGSFDPVSILRRTIDVERYAQISV